MKNSAKLSSHAEVKGLPNKSHLLKMELFDSKVIVKNNSDVSESAKYKEFLKMLSDALDALQAVEISNKSIESLCYAYEEIQKYAVHMMLNAEIDEYSDYSDDDRPHEEEENIIPPAWFFDNNRPDVAPIFVEEEYSEKNFEPWW